jgi:phosphomannomutase
MASEYNVIFAYEEALEYISPLISYDKDGISAASVFLILSNTGCLIAVVYGAR